MMEAEHVIHIFFVFSMYAVFYLGSIEDLDLVIMEKIYTVLAISVNVLFFISFMLLEFQIYISLSNEGHI